MVLTWKAKPAAEPLDEERLARSLRALGHPKRIRIMRRLLERRRGQCGELALELQAAQSTVSQHLAVLLDAGLLSVEADGTRRWYRIRPDAVDRIREQLAEW